MPEVTKKIIAAATWQPIGVVLDGSAVTLTIKTGVDENRKNETWSYNKNRAEATCDADGNKSFTTHEKERYAYARADGFEGQLIGRIQSLNFSPNLQPFAVGTSAVIEVPAGYSGELQFVINDEIYPNPAGEGVADNEGEITVTVSW